MKHLLTLTDEDVFGNTANLPSSHWQVRTAARAVVVGDKGEVYLLNMSARNYHKLPGGGIDAGETREQAVKRELFEEIGCPIAIEKELGEIVEFRNEERMEQHSFCFLAKKAGDLIDTALEEGELDDGAETVIAENLDEAIALLEKDEPANYEGHFIRLRDLRFLREAKSHQRER